MIRNPNATLPGTEGYVKAKVTYPTPATKISTTFSFTTLDPLVAMIAELAVGGMDTLMYTNDMIGTLAGLNGALYNILKEEAGSSWSDLSALLRNSGGIPDPQTLARHLSEDQFANARAKLATLTDWSEYNAEEYHWGLVEGDKEGFIRTATAVLRPVLSLIYYNANIPDTIQPTYRDYISDGTYEKVLIPLLEALGCPDSI